MQTNATSGIVATALEGLGGLDQGTLVSLKVRKKGVQRGPQGARKIYGDDLVHVLLWAGFSYKALIERSHRKLEALNDGTLIGKLTKLALDQGCRGANTMDTCAAIQDIQEWFMRLLGERKALPPWENEEYSSVWEPLKINEVKVKGARVYRGPARPQMPRSPVPGQVYLQGVKIGETVVETAENGPWRANSSARAITKAILQDMLPVGLFSQYVLDPERLADLRVGAAASVAAKAGGVVVDPEAIRSLFKIA